MKHSALKKFAAAAVLAVSFTGLSMVSASAAEPAPAPAVKVTAGHDQRRRTSAGSRCEGHRRT